MVQFSRVIGRAEAMDSEGRWVPGWLSGFLSGKGREAVLMCGQGWTGLGSGSRWLVGVCFSGEARWTAGDALGEPPRDQKSAFMKKWETKRKNPQSFLLLLSGALFLKGQTITPLARVRLMVETLFHNPPCDIVYMVYMYFRKNLSGCDIRKHLRPCKNNRRVDYLNAKKH